MDENNNNGAKKEVFTVQKETKKLDKKIITIVAIIVGVIAIGLLVYFLCFYKSKAVRETEAAIDSIGEVTLDSGSIIEDAEQMYGALTDKEKGQVENLRVLEDARDEYTELCDKDAANQVDLLIGLIGEVDRSSESRIKTAREAYEDLTKKQKQYVEKLDVLEKAEEDFEVLDVKECEELINDIADAADDPEIALPIALQTARTAYDALSSSHKKLVSNYANLEAAEKAYDEFLSKKDALKIKQEHEQRLNDRESYMNSCQAVTYAQLISNPDTYEGKDIAVKVDIVNVEAAKFLKKGVIVAKPAGGRIDNPISLIDDRSVKEPEFTAGTTLTVYGTFNGVNTITSYVEGSGLLGSNLFAAVDTETQVPEISVAWTSTDDTEAIDSKPTTTEIFNYVEEGLDVAKDITGIIKQFIP